MRTILDRAPDVVLLDVHMPGGGGVEVIRRCGAETAGQRFLALSVSDAAEDVIAVVRAGARGYVTKTIAGPELADAVRRVRDGDAVFSPRLAGFVLDAFAGQLTEAEVDPELDQLTDPRARGPAPDRPRLPLQGDRARALDLAEDRRGPRQRGAAQAPALQPPRAQPLGGGAAPGGLGGSATVARTNCRAARPRGCARARSRPAARTAVRTRGPRPRRPSAAARCR